MSDNLGIKSSNSVSEIMDSFIIINNNVLKLLEALYGNIQINDGNDKVEIILQNPLTKEYETLEFYSYKQVFDKVNAIEQTLKALVNINTDEITLLMPDGSLKRLYQRFNIKDIEPIKSLGNPTEFDIKNNWFLEDMLNPNLFISFDLSKHLDMNAKEVKVRRIILNNENYTNIQTSVLGKYINKKIDINHDLLIKDLNSNNISYIIDDNIRTLPVTPIKYNGVFKILSMNLDIKNNNIINYIFDKITYTDTDSTVKDSMFLKQGDVLHVGDNSKYKISNIDQSTNTIQLELLTGFEILKQGSNLYIATERSEYRRVDVNISSNERQFIFTKSIEPIFKTESSVWSMGVYIDSNQLTIKNGKTNLLEYYKKYVLDFGNILLGYAKEKYIPAFLGVKPQPPILNINNFKVVRINGHLDEENKSVLNNYIADKTKIKDEIEQLNIDINNEKNKNVIDIEKLNNLLKSRESSITSFKSVNENIINLMNNVNITNPKYRVRGFFDIPSNLISNNTQNQNVIQFNVRYRYLSLKGDANKPEQFNYVDINNNQKVGTFSNWIEYKTDIKKRTFNSITGFYEWLNEDSNNPEDININQIDIPINKGEKVQLKIQSVSEAGWPLNPIISDWGTEIEIPFDETLVTDTSLDIIAQQSIADKARLDMENSLFSSGLTEHLFDTSMISTKKYLHSANTIRIQVGNNTYDLQKVMNDVMSMLTTLTDKSSKFKIYIKDANGQVLFKINDKGSYKIFAGYYCKDNTEIQKTTTPKSYIEDILNTTTTTSNNTTTSTAGKIIEQIYYIEIEPDTTSVIELLPIVTNLNSNLISLSEDSNFNIYKGSYINFVGCNIKNIVKYLNERGELNPIINFKPFASSINNNFLFGVRNIDLNGETLIAYNDNNFNYLNLVGYDTTFNNICFDGRLAFNNLQKPIAGIGLYSNFTMHRNHPIIKKVYNNKDLNQTFSIFSNSEDNVYKKLKDGINVPDDEFVKKQVNNYLTALNIQKNIVTIANSSNNSILSLSNKNINYSDFFINQSSETPTTINNINDFVGNDGDLDAYRSILNLRHSKYINSDYIQAGLNTKDSETGFMSIKTLFNVEEDKWLIGSQTCGAYLSILFDNINKVTVKKNENYNIPSGKSLKIPIIYQYRMSDTDGKVGGYTQNYNEPERLEYKKKIGLDLNIKGYDDKFSFDIEFYSLFKNYGTVDVDKEIINEGITGEATGGATGGATGEANISVTTTSGGTTSNLSTASGGSGDALGLLGG